MGSSTINGGILSSTAAILEVIRGLKFKEKVGAAFGSYGWSGEAPRIIEKRLTEAGIEIMAAPVKMKYDPTPEDLEECEAYGETLAAKMQA